MFILFNFLAFYEIYRHLSFSFNIDVFQYLALSLPNGLDLTDSNSIEAVDTVLNLVQLRDKLHQSIQALSGGEWQRVRLAGVCLQV